MSGEAGQDLEIAKERIHRLFRFLADFQAQRTRVVRRLAQHDWVLRLRDLPGYPTIEIRRSESARISRASSGFRSSEHASASVSRARSCRPFERQRA